MKQRMVILGAGQVGRAAEALLDWNTVCLCAFGDNSPAAWNAEACPPVLPVDQALATGPELVLLGVLDQERSCQLERQARALGYSGPLLSLGQLAGCLDIRGAVLRRMAQRLGQVPGDLAELGVYRGGFAWQLNALFPQRRLYLFDTFQGFPPGDLHQESGGGTGIRSMDFSDTGVEEVLARLPHPEQAVVRQGRFPETAQGLDTYFALVSLDADLYAPTLAGLEFFYPRLSPGGAILLHDYNSRQFDGVKRAVSDYEHKHGPLPLVPLCDLHGTAVLIRPGKETDCP